MTYGIGIFLDVRYAFSQLSFIYIKEPLCKHWIVPIIQGHFEVERCTVDILDGFLPEPQRADDDEMSSDEEDGFTPVKDFVTGEGLKENEYDIVLISRRSKYRAGMFDSNCNFQVFFSFHCSVFIVQSSLFSFQSSL